MDEENAEPFGFDAAGIDYVLLTHAHLDHCGRLPLLAKRGFRGEVITTSASRELTRLVMLDAAYLLEEDARHRGRRGGHGGANNDTKNPLYSTLDALNCLDNFGRTAAYSESFEVTAGVILPSSTLAIFLARPVFFCNFLNRVIPPTCCFPAIWVTPVASCCAAP